MALTLVELIAASGNSAPGDFVGEVTGASGGANMLEYVLGGGGESGDLPQPPAEITYASGTVFTNIVVTWSAGSKFSLIQRTELGAWSLIGTANATLNSVTWLTGPFRAILNITILGEYDSDTLPTLSSFNFWFNDFPFPGEPPDSGTYNVTITPTTGGGGSPTGTDDRTIRYSYIPDNGSYNPTYQTPNWSVRISRRAYPSWSTVFEFEVHTSASYDNLVSATISSDPATTASRYVRYRIRAAYNGGSPGAWTNYGEVAWTDPRPDV